MGRHAEKLQIQHKYTYFEKLFQQITGIILSTLHHDLHISRTYCNYVLCSLDPGEYIGHN